jgi:hypothetical protein
VHRYMGVNTPRRPDSSRSSAALLHSRKSDTQKTQHRQLTGSPAWQRFSWQHAARVAHAHEHLVHGGGARRRPADELEHGGDDMRHVGADARRLHGRVPRNVRAQRRVHAVHNLEARLLGRSQHVRQVAHVRQRVALSHAVNHAHVRRVSRVVHRRLQPLVRRKLAARLQHLRA